MAMYLTDLVLEQSTRLNPYDLHRRLWQLFELPPGSERPFQFRVEQCKGSLVSILMQSSIPTAMDTDHIRVMRQKQFSPAFVQGQQLRFRLKANPIKTIKDEKGRTNGKGEIKSCRVPLIKEEEQIEWLSRKLEGVATLGEVVIRSRENIYFRKGNRAGKVVAVTFEGLLQVQNDSAFIDMVASGIGPAKGLGCGMLSLAPA
jgi:CRISPR system Cascade subunit CasE